MLRDKDQRAISNLTTPDGDIERPIDGASWGLPERIELGVGNICWSGAYGGQRVQPQKGMFENFLALGEAPEHRILKYAQRWGVLLLKSHTQARTNSNASATPYSSQRSGPPPESEGIEPIEIWRCYSREFLALMKIANRLANGEAGRPEDWNTVYARCFLNAPARSKRVAPFWKQTLDNERFMIESNINAWLDLAGVKPYFDWRPGAKRPSIRFGGTGLLGALALQLAIGVAQAKGLALCTHCASEYPPEQRRPKQGQRHFCPDCRKKGIPTRYSLADYRQRLSKEKKHGK
jgi:hypothetical protein